MIDLISSVVVSSNDSDKTFFQSNEFHFTIYFCEDGIERLNWQRKAFATDSLPFIMIPELVRQVLPQLQAEAEHQTYQALKGSLEGESFAKVLTDAVQSIGSNCVEVDTQILFRKITDYLLDKRWESFEPLFGLSSDEEMQLQSVLSRVNSFDPKTFGNYQKRINASLDRSKEIRATLQASSIEHFESYIQTLSVLEELYFDRTKHVQILLECIKGSRILNGFHGKFSKLT